MTDIDPLADRIAADLNGGMSALSLYLGLRLGLFDALAESGPATAAEIGERTGLHGRYVKEWLSSMTAGRYIAYDPASQRFSLPEAHRDALIDPGNPGYALGIVSWLPSLAGVTPRLMEAFKNGGGVPYAEYGLDMIEGQAESTRPMFLNDFVASWLPAMPDVEAKLRDGGRALEVGGGVGWASIALAKAFEDVHIDFVDPDDLSVEQAEANSQAHGVAERIAFHPTTVEAAPVTGAYHLVWAFECLHDMPYPVSALRRMRELAGPDGAVLIADERVEDALEENTNFLGHMLYNFSVLHCLPQAMAFPDAAGTGTVIGPSTMQRYAEEAGFASTEVLPIDNPQFRFYRLHP